MIITKDIYICVLDFEATCEDGSEIHEVIEFPSVLYLWQRQYYHNQPEVTLSYSFQLISEFQEFVKPKKNPIVSSFCHNLTHITQDQVNNGRPFPVVLQAHYTWLLSNIPNFFDQEVYIMTCGNWDLQTMATIEYKIHHMQPDDIPAVYLQFINIKSEFKSLMKSGKRRGKGRGAGERIGGGLAAMLQYYHLTFIGHPHSGIDDCRNTARVFEKMLENGYILRNDTSSIHRVAYFGSDGKDYGV